MIATARVGAFDRLVPKFHLEMAAMNRTHSTQFLDDMIRRKESINATIALSDRRQWPALGQSAEIEHVSL